MLSRPLRHPLPQALRIGKGVGSGLDVPRVDEGDEKLGLRLQGKILR
jgi:hypothetical protein